MRIELISLSPLSLFYRQDNLYLLLYKKYLEIDCLVVMNPIKNR